MRVAYCKESRLSGSNRWSLAALDDQSWPPRSVDVETLLRGRGMVEPWGKGIGVASPDSCTERSADCSLRPIRISSQRPENSRFHLKPLLALLGGCSLPAPGVMRIPDAVLFFSGTGSSSTTRGNSLKASPLCLFRSLARNQRRRGRQW